MRRHTTALAAAAAATLLLAATPATTTAPTPTVSDPVATAGAWWADQQFAVDGSVLGRTGSPDVGTTIAATVGMLAAGHVPTSIDASVAFVEANLEGYVTGSLGDRPGQLANAIVFTLVTGGDPRDVAGEDLVERLVATEQRFPSPDAGRFGANLDLFGQTYSHATAVLALALVPDVAPSATSIAYLLDTQCQTGGFPSGYRTVVERVVDRCTGDTNASGLAAAALGVIHGDDGSPTAAAAEAVEAFLAAARNPDGGWGYSPTGATDGNSTGLAAFGLAALGVEEPTDAPGASAALAALQLGCDAGADAGGIRYAAGDARPDRFATVQALLAFSSSGLAEVVAAAATPSVDDDPLPVVDPCVD